MDQNLNILLDLMENNANNASSVNTSIGNNANNASSVNTSIGNDSNNENEIQFENGIMVAYDVDHPPQAVVDSEA